MHKKTSNKTIWIAIIIIAVILVFVGLFSESDKSSQSNEIKQNEKSVSSCDSEFPIQCDGECFNCESGSKLCCVSSKENWCCPNNQECDYINKDCKTKYVAPTYYCGDGSCNSNEDCSSCSSDCGLCEKDILSNIKKTIVWVKYTVTGKNYDGSYFENGGTGSGVIVGNKNNELTIYTNRHVTDCEYNDINCFQRISETVQVRTQDGKMYQVDRVSFSKSDIDLAILTIKTSNSDDYPFAYYTDKFEINDKVIAVGYPTYAQNVVEFSVSEGKITNIKDLLSQSTGDDFRAIESDVYTYFGSSGGGLFDKQGNLIGINTWIAETQTSIAIDFSSISEKNFVYCDDNSYFADGNCYNLCDREQVRDYKNRACYEACKEFYCNSQIPTVNDQRCKDAGYILGSDGYCHQPCASSNSYCQTGSICLRNRCYSQCSYGYLWEDGSCRYYE
jgi:S1-C subfamily serine protease